MHGSGWIDRLTAGELRRGLRNRDFRPGTEERAARARLLRLTSAGTDRPRGVITLRTV